MSEVSVLPDKLILNAMKFNAHIGCSEAEREKAQPLIIDAELNLDLSKSGTSDNLSDTVDYVQVFQLIDHVISQKPRNLIEALAEDIASSMLHKFKLIDSVKLTILKPSAPIDLPFDGAAVSIVRNR